VKTVSQLVDKYNDKISKMDNVELIQVSRDKNVEKATAWAKKESFPWPTVLMADQKKTFVKDIKINGVPTYVLLDKDGNILVQANDSGTVMDKLAEVNK